MFDKCNNIPVISELINRTSNNVMLNDIITLHINHFLDDVLIFDGILNSIFPKSVLVTVPYRNAVVPGRYPGTLYHAAFRENGFELFCSGQPLAERAESFGEAMESMIFHALRHTIAPALTGSRKLLVIEDGGYHYEPLRRGGACRPRIHYRRCRTNNVWGHTVRGGHSAIRPCLSGVHNRPVRHENTLRGLFSWPARRR